MPKDFFVSPKDVQANLPETHRKKFDFSTNPPQDPLVVRIGLLHQADECTR